MELRQQTPYLTVPDAPTRVAGSALAEPLRQRLEFFSAVQRLRLDVEPLNVTISDRQLWFGPRWRALSPLVLFGTFYGFAAFIGWGLLPLLLRITDMAGNGAFSVAAVLLMLATAAVPFATIVCAGAIAQAMAVVRLDGQSFIVTQTGPDITHPTMPRAVREKLEKVRNGELPHVERIALLEQQVDPILAVRVGGRWYSLGRWV
jgi:hypothetical protein